MKTFSWFYMCVLVLTLSACSTLGNQGSPCTDNANCQEGLKCLANHCGDGQQGSICEDDSHCLTQKSFFCVQQVCTRGVKEPPTEFVDEPLQDASETVITDIQPEPSPEIPENIQETQIEANTEEQQDPPTEPEGKLCTQEDDCPTDTYCLVREGGLEARCASAPPSCKRDADCATIGKGSVCRPFANRNNQIRLACLYPITTGSPIKQGGEPCTRDEDCSSLRCLKEYNVCGAFCQQDSDCPNHFYCGTYSLFPHGEFQGCYPQCTSDSDCTEGYTCDQNRCVVSGSPAPGTPCRVDSDCGTN